MHAFCSSLTKFLSTKSVQTKFVAPQNPSADTCLVIKAIISHNNFKAIDKMKRSGTGLFFSEFHKNLGQDYFFLSFTKILSVTSEIPEWKPGLRA